MKIFLDTAAVVATDSEGMVREGRHCADWEKAKKELGAKAER